MKIKLPLFAFALALVSLGISRAAESSPAQTFVRKAAIGGMFEVKMGEVAQKNSESPKIKEFGGMMVMDHGKAGVELAAIAGKQGIKVPAQLPKKMQTKADKISGLTGKAFDAAYVAEMVTDHEKALADFKTAAKTLSDPELKAFAEKTSGMIQGHLDAIQKIQADMNKAASPL